MKSLLLSSLLLGFVSIARADVTFQSGNSQVALIELYTSEGCSSCPPAEKWLAGLREAKGLWTSFVPVAFHVNYWDHLGWKDRLATPAFTQREHVYAAKWRSDSVYTPCFVRNGAEWRPANAAHVEPATPAADPGQLKLTWQASGTVRVEYMPKDMPDRMDVSVALLGGGIVSNVRAGENSGRKLQHEFVALQIETVALSADARGVMGATLQLQPRPDVIAARHALAAWVTKRGEQAPRQATGGWID